MCAIYVYVQSTMYTYVPELCKTSEISLDLAVNKSQYHYTLIEHSPCNIALTIYSNITTMCWIDILTSINSTMSITDQCPMHTSHDCMYVRT